MKTYILNYVNLIMYCIQNIQIFDKESNFQMFLHIFFEIQVSLHPFNEQLNKNNFFDHVGKKNHIIIHCFSEGCPHCADMRPTWNEVSRMYHTIEGIELLVLNCNKYQSLCVAIDGSSTPNIQYYAPHSRKMSTLYGGNYDNISLVRWIKENTGLMPFHQIEWVVATKE